MVQKRNAVVKGSGQAASLDNGSQVCQVKGETGECLGGYNIIEQTGNKFLKILVQCGGLYDLQATVTNRNYLCP